MMTAELRNRLLEWLREHGDLQARMTLGTAVIVTSPFIRLTVNLLRHLRPSRVPCLLVSNEAEAVAWCADRLRDAGLHAQAEHIRRHFGLLLANPSG
jgi:hypothetical protein